MAVGVADRSSNKNEQIVHAAEVIGRSKHRAAVFTEVYRGKKRSKTVDELIQSTNLERKRVLDAGKALADNDILQQLKIDGKTAYMKIEFFNRYRRQILRLSRDKQSRDAVPTKRNVQPKAARGQVVVKLRLPKAKVAAVRITVDDIDSFAAVRSVPLGQAYIKMPESSFKRGVASILGERAEFKDWGGELRDLSSSRLLIDGIRRTVAFAFKGPGMTGRLVPGKLGKNGDQIQRLASCPADVFIIQYWRDIDDAVVAQLEQLVQAKSFLQNRKFWYGIMDGQDSARLIQAYPKKFSKPKK